MGNCKSYNKISNEYVIMVQLMLRDLDDTNFEMLVLLERLNNMVYGYETYFNYEISKDEFINTTNQMKQVLTTFQNKNKFILNTLYRKPDEYWVYHNAFCQQKCDKMIEFDKLKKVLENDTTTRRKRKRQLETWLLDDIDIFNKSMTLPTISKKNIMPLLSDVLKYADPPKLNSENSLLK
jgi:hypothetical protein